jgi:type IV secretion system protein VirB2
MSVTTAATDWVVGLVTGPILTTLLLIAIALLAFTMLSGRLPLRRGSLVILGCFILTGAAEISRSMMEFVPNTPIPALPSGPAPIKVQELPALGPKPERTPSTGNPFDPYPGGKPVN